MSTFPSVSHRWLQRGLGLVAAFSLFGFAGCAGPTPPKDSPPVNAVIPGHYPIYHNSPGSNSADVILIAQFYGHDRYSKNKMGDSETDWELEIFAVNKVEKGPWSQSALYFIVVDTGQWTPEKYRAWPYRPGYVYRFWIDTSSTPARIVGQQALTGPNGII
jgi:hypothetical protein